MSSKPPLVPAQRELTPISIFLGILLSLVMGAANVYVGLKAGMTVSASIPAAVMAMSSRAAPTHPSSSPPTRRDDLISQID